MLRFKDVGKRDMLSIGISTDSQEMLACDRTAWETRCTEDLRVGEKQFNATLDARWRSAERPMPHPLMTTKSVVLVVSSVAPGVDLRAILERVSGVVKSQTKLWTMYDIAYYCETC